MKSYIYCASVLLPLSLHTQAEEFTHNLRWSVDLSSRVIHSRNRDTNAYVQAWGLDAHKVFSDEYGDWGTLVTQVYATRIDNLKPHPGFFDDDHDWELVYRIFNLNLTRWSDSFANIKLGHIELPFGLEHTITTNGDLRDYNHGRNLGPKADWGIGLNNQYQNWEYEVTLTTGGGQSLDRGDDSYIFAGRIGTNRDEQWVVGFSAYKADLSGADRRRVAVDFQTYWDLYGLILELAGGSKNSVNQLDGLIEFNWRSADEVVLAYTQYQYFSQKPAMGWQSSAKWVAGVKYTPDQHWDVSGRIIRDARVVGAGDKETQLAFQLRYRF